MKYSWKASLFIINIFQTITYCLSVCYYFSVFGTGLKKKTLSIWAFTLKSVVNLFLWEVEGIQLK